MSTLLKKRETISTHICYSCEGPVRVGTAYNIDGKYFCSYDCLEEGGYAMCGRCGSIRLSDDLNYDSFFEDNICNDCSDYIDRNTGYCENCDNRFWDDDLDRNGYCSDCHDNMEDEDDDAPVNPDVNNEHRTKLLCDMKKWIDSIPDKPIVIAKKEAQTKHVTYKPEYNPGDYLMTTIVNELGMLNKPIILKGMSNANNFSIIAGDEYYNEVRTFVNRSSVLRGVTISRSRIPKMVGFNKTLRDNSLASLISMIKSITNTK